MKENIVDELLNKIREKGFFSEYLPEAFNLEIEGFNLYTAGASYKDRVEPYSYYMSRFGKTGDRRMISIPEVASYVSLVNFLEDNQDILHDIIQLSVEDDNSFSRIVNKEYEIIDTDDFYGDFIGDVNVTVDGSAESQEEEKDRSVYVKNMLHKIQITRGACGILHIDISEFYKSIYTHMLSVIKLGVDGAQEAFLKNSRDVQYIRYVKFDDRVRRLNGARTNGILVGPYMSRVLSEAILAKVDEELRKNEYIFTRYADDYEFAVYKEYELEDMKSNLTAVFEKYYFKINNEKTYYEKYPFYIFSNYEKIVRRLAGKEKIIDSIEIIELFNKFLQMEKEGEKGAVRYLLKTYKNEYQIEDKKLYASYLLNTLCNDEKALGLACRIIIREYEEKRIEVDDYFYRIIVNKLQYEMKKNHELEIIWLTYLLKYTDYEMTKELLWKIIKSKSELAIIIVIEEWNNFFSSEDIEMCWEKATSWLLLYQIALKYPDRQKLFFEKMGIEHNKKFYKKLFEKKFTFYKKKN